MRVLDGKTVSQKILEEVKGKVEVFLKRHGRPPSLRVLLVGEHPASTVYVRRKKKIAQKVGLDADVLHLPATVSKEELLNKVETLNQNPNVDGILVQLPLPPHISTQEVIPYIDPQKDVDGFHPLNLGYLYSGNPRLVACTPKGILRLLDHYNIDVEGKRVVVVGRSLIVGRPMAALMLLRHATVTVVHSRTPNPERVAQEADILIVAAGKRHLVNDRWVRPGAVVVDVGIHRTEDGKLTGDVDIEEVGDRASWITPVPGGVGPMTITELMDNVTIAASWRLEG